MSCPQCPHCQQAESNVYRCPKCGVSMIDAATVDDHGYHVAIAACACNPDRVLLLKIGVAYLREATGTVREVQASDYPK